MLAFFWTYNFVLYEVVFFAKRSQRLFLDRNHRYRWCFQLSFLSGFWREVFWNTVWFFSSLRFSAACSLFKLRAYWVRLVFSRNVPECSHTTAAVHRIYRCCCIQLFWVFPSESHESWAVIKFWVEYCEGRNSLRNVFLQNDLLAKFCCRVGWAILVLCIPCQAKHSHLLDTLSCIPGSPFFSFEILRSIYDQMSLMCMSMCVYVHRIRMYQKPWDEQIPRVRRPYSSLVPAKIPQLPRRTLES